MKYPLRFGVVVCVMCSAFLFSQTNPSSTVHSYRYELSTRSQEYKFANEIPSTAGVGGTRYEVETDAQGRIMRVATIRKDQKLSEILYRFAADAKLPSEYESFVAGEKTGVVRIQRDEAGNRIREDYLTVGGTLTRYETYSYSPEHVEDVHYAADGKKTGYYDLYYSAKDTLIRAIYYFITDPWYTDTEFDDGTGRTKSKKEFKDGKLKATVSCTYNADGDLSRCDTDIYDAALHWYATEEFNDDLPTKRTYKEANGATKEVQFKYDEKRWLKESALYYEGVFVCRFVYDRLPDGTVKRTLALGPNGEPWAEYPDMEITNVQRNGEAPAGKSIIHKTGNWWNPSSSEHKQESKSSVTVSIFPHPNMEVPVGGSQVVTATIDGSTNTAVKWSISGSGCSGSACGTVSAGLYLAPSILPNPPTVKLTATSEADPNASDSIAVQIGHSTLTSAWKQDDGNASFGLGPVLRVGGGVSAPHAVYAPDPEYSKQAREANYRGTCVLWLIVGTDGLPRNIKVVRSVGMGMDENVVEAVKLWRFQPAMKDGKPVAVQIKVEVTFRPN